MHRLNRFTQRVFPAGLLFVAGVIAGCGGEESAPAPAAEMPREEAPRAINIGGGDVTTVDGTFFSAERFVTGGALAETDKIKGSQNPGLFRECRTGDVAIDLPLPSGTYDLTFYFSEPDEIGGRERLFDVLAEGEFSAAVFSAAVSDYRPKTFRSGKIASGQELTLELEPTAKVIGEVRQQHPALHMVTFKYQEQISHDQLMAIAEDRLETYETVIANRGDETEPGGPQVAWLVTRDGEPQRMKGKLAIARRLADHLEHALA